MDERTAEISVASSEYDGAVDVERVRNLFPEVSTADERAVQAELNRLPPEVSGSLDGETRHYLALLEAKDHVWLEHSVGVLQLGALAYPEFKNDIGVSRDTFNAACALHDTGKLGLPDSILRNEIASQDFQLNFFLARQRGGVAADFITQRLQERGLLAPGREVGECSVEELQEMHLDYRDYINLRTFFRTNRAGVEETERYGLDPDATSFMDAIRRHEKLSAELLRGLDRDDREQVATLAGDHHGYDRQPGELQPVGATVLRLIDQYHAIVQRRSYDREHTPIEALWIIVQEAQAGTVDASVTRRWAGFMLADLERQRLRLSVDRGDAERYVAVKQFVDGSPVTGRRVSAARR